MDSKTLKMYSADKSEELLHKKIERISHNAEDRCLTHEEIDMLKDIWKTLWYIQQVNKE